MSSESLAGPPPRKNLLSRLAGGRDDIVTAVPGSGPRFTAMGGVLLSTAAIAAVSATFALRMAVGVPVPVAVLFGLGWGVVILNLDRMLIVGMGHERSLRRSLGLGVPRLMLALVLGTVISTPLTLQIFHKEIEAELVVLHQQTEDDYKRKLAADTELGRIPALQQKVETEQGIVDGSGPVDPNKDPRVLGAQAAVTTARTAYDQAAALSQKLDAAAQCELNGTCGTGVNGVGEAYRQAAANAARQRTLTTAAKQKLDAAQAALAAAQRTAAADAASAGRRTQATAAQDLAADQQELTRLTGKRDALQKEFESRARSDDGILARLEALDALGRSRPILQVAQILVALLFVCVELLPVAMKLLANAGEPTAYDLAVGVSEETSVEAYRQHQAAWLDAEAERAATTLTVEKDRAAQQRKVGLLANEKIVEHQLEIVEAALAAWGRQARIRSEEQLREYEREMGPPARTEPETEDDWFVPPRTGSTTTAGDLMRLPDADDL